MLLTYSTPRLIAGDDHVSQGVKAMYAQSASPGMDNSSHNKVTHLAEGEKVSFHANSVGGHFERADGRAHRSASVHSRHSGGCMSEVTATGRVARGRCGLLYPLRSQLSHEGDQVLLLRSGQLELKDDVEELDRILECEQAAVV